LRGGFTINFGFYIKFVLLKKYSSATLISSFKAFSVELVRFFGTA